MVALVLTVTIALGVSFLCSILEAALFSVRTTELGEREAAGDRHAKNLRDLKEDRLDDAISAILVLNTIAHTIGAAMAGAQAADVFGSAWVGAFSAVLTLLVLVLTEIVPKTIGAAYASRLVPFVSVTLALLMRVLYPILLVTRGITRLIAHGSDNQITRGEVKAMVETAGQLGLLQKHESQIVTNALRLGRVPLDAVMTPRPVVHRLSADAPVSSLLDTHRDVNYTRVPLFDTDEEDIIGYILVPEALRKNLDGENDATLRDLARPLPSFEETASVADALRTLIRGGDHIALVHDKFGGMAGIVTLEDLLETLLGAEIIDESDEVPDLRELARQLREERRARRGESPAAAPETETESES